MRAHRRGPRQRGANAASSSRRWASESAFRRSGRFMVMVAQVAARRPHVLVAHGCSYRHRPRVISSRVDSGAGLLLHCGRMILTRDAIQREIDAGRVVIEPFTPDQVGPASIDLHLGDEIRVMAGGAEPVAVTERRRLPRRVTQVRPLDAPYVLAARRDDPRHHARARPLPADMAGWLEGRSRFARLGLMIHVTSGFVAPGVDSRQVLEMSNVAGRPLVIHAGVRLCQIVLQRCEGRRCTQGRFARQDRL